MRTPSTRAAAVQLNILLKRGAQAGEPIFKNDIADVTGSYTMVRALQALLTIGSVGFYT